MILPSPEILAGLVSNVTQTMLGISFQPDHDSQAISQLQWRTAVLPIPGAEPVTVGLSSDELGCTTLSAKMFSCAPEAVDPEMAEDALRELVNMTAGLVKSTLGLNQALGLPRIYAPGQPLPEAGRPIDSSLVLKARTLGLVLWVHRGILEES